MATLVSVKKAEQSPGAPVEIEVPASTAWPLVLAFGFTLMFAGLLTSASVSVLGVVLAVAGCVGWFREVFPHEHEEAVPIVFEDHRITTERRVVERVPVAPDLVRAWLPLETYPISAGLKGGLAGGVAMAVLACTYGLLKAGSIWYPINLLAATVYAESLKLGNSQLNSFHADSFAIALVLHGIGSIFVGLLYGAMLPMFARRPIVLGGLITPVLWSGLLYSIMQLLNPLLASRIDWIWFMASQIAFGAVAGIVVVRQERISTRENLPFLVRAGIEAPGVILPHGQPKKGSEVLAPNEVLEFGTLYAENCAGCHGAEGRGGAAIALANPVYLAIADDAAVRKVIANGVRGTAMPAFAKSAGGMLTDAQIDVITKGIRSRSSQQGVLDTATAPSYAPKSAGDGQRGEVAYKTYCESCHGPGGKGGRKGSPITDDSFLALVSDQGLRTIVITGRPELGAPDWRGNLPGRAMSDQEVTDVVAWLASHRVQH